MTIDFRKLGEIAMEDIQRPKALAAGPYHAIVKGYRPGESKWANKETGEKEAVYLVDVELQEPTAEIADELNGTSVKGKVFSREYSVQLDRLYILKGFLNALLGKEKIVGQKLPDVMEQIAGHAVIANIGKRQDKNDPEVEYNDLKSISVAN